MNPGGIVLLNMCLNMRMVSKMEDKVYVVDMLYPRVAALLRRAYAGEDSLGELLVRCTSVTPISIMTQFEQVLKDLERNSGTLEVNGACLGTVANIEVEIDKDECDGLKEFIAAMLEEAEKPPIKPLYCPFDNTRGCVDGDIWIIEHTRVEDGYKTSECRIRNRKCRAWSDEYGRCVRLQPITGADKARAHRELLKRTCNCGDANGD